MVTFSLFQVIVFMFILMAFPLLLHFRTKTMMSVKSINDGLVKDIRAKDKVIDELALAVADLESEKNELSEKLEMLEETLTRAGITADVWNAEDKVNDG